MREKLAAEHRAIEAELERLTKSLNTGLIDLDAFRRACVLCRELYPREQEFLRSIHPEAARKIARQHEEALELAASVEGPDADYLARRFVAIVQHTIIEVERDLFPLAAQG